jgi:hypothetical protein
MNLSLSLTGTNPDTYRKELEQASMLDALPILQQRTHTKVLVKIFASEYGVPVLIYLSLFPKRIFFERFFP